MLEKSYCAICRSKTSYIIQRIACSLAPVRVTSSLCQPVQGSRLDVIVRCHFYDDISSITTYRVAAALRLADVAEEPLEGQRNIHTYSRALWKPYIWLGHCAREGNGKPLLVPFPRKQQWQLCHACRQGSDATQRHYISILTWVGYFFTTDISAVDVRKGNGRKKMQYRLSRHTRKETAGRFSNL